MGRSVHHHFHDLMVPKRYPSNIHLHRAIKEAQTQRKKARMVVINGEPERRSQQNDAVPVVAGLA